MSKRNLPRQPRDASPGEANLDDLFDTFEPAPFRPRDLPHERPWVLRSALQAFAASAVVYTVFRIGALAPPYPLIFAVCAGAVLVRHAVRVTAEPSTQRVSDAVRPRTARQASLHDGWYEGGDGVLDAVRRWDRRLEWGSSARERFAATVALRLGELADERLRLRHGITRATDPARARALLGEPLWQLLAQTSGPQPKPRDLAAAVAHLEAL